MRKLFSVTYRSMNTVGLIDLLPAECKGVIRRQHSIWTNNMEIPTPRISWNNSSPEKNSTAESELELWNLDQWVTTLPVSKRSWVRFPALPLDFPLVENYSTACRGWRCVFYCPLSIFRPLLFSEKTLALRWPQVSCVCVHICSLPYSLTPQ